MELWYVKNNKEKLGRILNVLRNQETLYFDLAIRKFYAPPGMDATTNIKLKSFENNQENLKVSELFQANIPSLAAYFSMIDLTLKAMTDTVLLENFDSKIEDLLKTIVPKYFRQFLIDTTPYRQIYGAFDCFCKSIFYDTETAYRKYLRDRRAEIFKTWIDVLRQRPCSLLLHSLDNFPTTSCNRAYVFKSHTCMQKKLFGFFPDDISITMFVKFL